MDPGWSDYRKYIEYVDYDISSFLHEGINAIGAEIANGWYIMDNTGYTFHFPSFMSENPDPYKPFGKYLVFCMKLIVTYRDGSEDIFYGDENFKVKEHPCLHSNVYGSEVYDASRQQEGWDTETFDDSSWKPASVAQEYPEAELVEQIQPPVKIIQTYPAVYLHTVHNRRIYDFTQNASFLLEFDIQGKPGEVIHIYPAEKLGMDGDVDQKAKGWLDIDTCITYVIGSEHKEHYRERFSYLGCRFIAIEGEAEITNLEAHAITSAWKRNGSFISDEQKYNRIYNMIEKTVEANMQSVHTDCPTIERFAWEEENHLMAPSIMFMKDGKKMWKKILKDMRSGQHTKDDFFHDRDGNKIPAGDGLIPSQCPCYIPNFLPVKGIGSFYDSIAWSSSIILSPYWHYLFYGDISILKDNFDAGLRYLNYLKTKITKDGFISHGLGDWGNPDHEYARENVETAFLYGDLITLGKAAQILHRKEENMLLDAAEKIKENYNQKLLQKDESGHYAYRCYDQKDTFTVTETCEALPLYWHMVPEEYEQDVVHAFRKTLISKNCLSAGEIGLPFVIQTASRYGMNDLIADFITRDEHPSYYAFIKDGMTTLGEYWEKNPRSHCHDMMGSIIAWYYTAIAGIQILKPGFKEIPIHPWMPDSMNAFDCSYQTPYGEIHIHGERKDGKADFSWTVPDTIKIERK